MKLDELLTPVPPGTEDGRQPLEKPKVIRKPSGDVNIRQAWSGNKTSKSKPGNKETP